jgi:PIN domain nuclease of toxin-antitoxin system
MLWLAEGSDRISRSVKQAIDREPIVSVSAISALEIALKTRSGKLELPMPVLDWWDRLIDHHRLDVVATTPELFARSAELPPIHRDPADRIIIATALEANASVVTSDSRFAEYGVRVIL